MTIDEAIELAKKYKNCLNSKVDECKLECLNCDNSFNLQEWDEVKLNIAEWLEDYKKLKEKIEKINNIVLLASDKKLEHTFQYASGIKLDYIKEIRNIIDDN